MPYPYQENNKDSLVDQWDHVLHKNTVWVIQLLTYISHVKQKLYEVSIYNSDYRTSKPSTQSRGCVPELQVL